MSPRRAPGFRVTDRDVAIVRWVGRLRMASAEQIADRFGLGRAVAYARLGGLVRLGLLEHQRIFHGSPGVYLATRSGLDAAEVDLPPATVDVRTYAHDLELSSVVAGLEAEFDSATVVTEREIRAQDSAPNAATGSEPQFAVRLQTGRGQLALTPVGNPRLHVPDAAVAQPEDPRPLAIELERTLKGRARIRGILSAYVSARHLAGVRYLVTDDAVERLVASESSALRAGSMVEVARFGRSGEQHRQAA